VGRIVAIAECPYCTKEFICTTDGSRALYWHLRKEHEASHAMAFDDCGQAMSCAHFNNRDGYGL